MVGFAPFSPRGEACLPARKPPFMHREKRGKLGPTLSEQRRSVCQLVPSMERRKNRDSYFVRRISKCSLDGDKGLHQLQSRSCYKTTWLPMRGAPLEEELTPIIARGFNKTNVEAL